MSRTARPRTSRTLLVATSALVLLVLVAGAWLVSQARTPADAPLDPSGGGTSASPSATADASLTPEQEAARAQALELMAAEPRRIEGDAYAKGDVDAPLVLIEFADFRCPYCAKHSQEVEPLLQKYVADGTLRIEWRDVPIFGAESTPVHDAARAAGRQGMFWEYHDAVFAQTPLEGHRSWDDAQLTAVATEIGVPDLAAWEADRHDPGIAAEVEADRAHATDVLGITSTPAFILGDVYIPGAYPLSTFVEEIDKQLAAADAG